jgi:hypothetical protein
MGPPRRVGADKIARIAAARRAIAVFQLLEDEAAIAEWHFPQENATLFST